MASFSVTDNYLEIPNLKFDCKNGKKYSQLKEENCNNDLVAQYTSKSDTCVIKRRDSVSSNDGNSSSNGDTEQKSKTGCYPKLFCLLMAFGPSSNFPMEPATSDQMYAVYEMQNNPLGAKRKSRWNRRRNKNKKDAEHTEECSQHLKNEKRSKTKKISESNSEEGSSATRKRTRRGRRRNKNKKNANLDPADSYETQEESSGSNEAIVSQSSASIAASIFPFLVSKDANLVSSSASSEANISPFLASNDANLVSSASKDVNPISSASNDAELISSVPASKDAYTMSTASNDAHLISSASNDAGLISPAPENRLTELQRLLLSVPPPTLIFGQNNNLVHQVPLEFQSPPPPYLYSCLDLDDHNLATTQSSGLNVLFPPLSEKNLDSAGQDECESDKHAETYEHDFKKKFKDLRNIWNAPDCDAADSSHKNADDAWLGMPPLCHNKTITPGLHKLLRESEDYYDRFDAAGQGIYQPYRYNFPKMPEPEVIPIEKDSSYNPFEGMVSRLSNLHCEWTEPCGLKKATEESTTGDKSVDFNSGSLDQLFQKLGIAPTKEEEIVDVDNVEEIPFAMDPIMNQELQSDCSEESEEEPTFTKEELERIIEGRARYDRVKQWVEEHHN